MTTHDVHADGFGATAQAVTAVVGDFIARQRPGHGAALADLLTDDAVLDLNVPRWRFQVGGGAAVADAFAASYPTGFDTAGWRWEPTPTGAVVEYDGWDGDHTAYYRHLVLLELRDGRIGRLTLYCTGGWDAGTVARQRREAPMVDDDAAPRG